MNVGLSLMPESDFRAASLPLFEQGEVDVLEWSFDVGWDAAVPAWAEALIGFYSANKMLLGHGVSFSALSGAWTPRQQRWLGEFERECSERDYRHITEHFGFMAAGSFHRGPPLPVPMTAGALRVGRDRLSRLAETSQKPVGLENLALALGLEDVRRQGEFLDSLLSPVDGVLLLDLHNIHCQAENFRCDPVTLLDSYPLGRVRELHVSGGSWSTPTDGAAGEKIRRDTHDGPVPREVFELVKAALKKCPQVEFVIFERLGDTIRDEAEADQFREDFRLLRRLVRPTPERPAP